MHPIAELVGSLASLEAEIKARSPKDIGRGERALEAFRDFVKEILQADGGAHHVWYRKIAQALNDLESNPADWCSTDKSEMEPLASALGCEPKLLAQIKEIDGRKILSGYKEERSYFNRRLSSAEYVQAQHILEEFCLFSAEKSPTLGFLVQVF